jgi:hypothetical protein
MTERQTNASRGKVVSMLRPKQLDTGQSYFCSDISCHSQSCYVHHDIVGREVVEHIALSLRSK